MESPVLTIELKIPAVGESVVEVQIAEWLKAEGDQVSRDEPVASIETDKVTVDLPAPVKGKLTRILVQKGARAKVGDVVGWVEADAEGSSGPQAGGTHGAPQGSGAVGSSAAPDSPPSVMGAHVMPAAARVLRQAGVGSAGVPGTGPGGRVLKEDAVRAVAAATTPAADAPVTNLPERHEESIPMTMLRRRVAERLLEAQQTTAMLTTFNEVDMSAVLGMRKQYQSLFQEKYATKLGFMSIFVKACVDGLKQFPSVNAEVRGHDVVYKNYYDIGVAVGGGKGLVVPVLRGAERLSFAQIETAIRDLAERAAKNMLTLQELTGGTFTITNGGVYGSLLSTPILNPPQSGILGLHGVQERPVAREGLVVIRPMMYVALTYDHRIVDGREAVTFLRRVKEAVEDPVRMLIEV